MKIQEAIIIRIQELCDEQNITINKLATISAVHPSTLKNILYGNSFNIGIVTITRLCDGLEISVKDFFTNEIFDSLEQDIQ